jgi:hypothetical protein
VLALRAIEVRRLMSGSLTIVPGGGAWRLSSPRAGVTLDDDHLARLLATLADLRALRFLPATTPLTPRARIVIERDAQPRLTLLLGERSDAGCRARLDDAPFDLAPSTCDALTAPLVRAE